MSNEAPHQIRIFVARKSGTALDGSEYASGEVVATCTCWKRAGRIGYASAGTVICSAKDGRKTFEAYDKSEYHDESEEDFIAPKTRRHLHG